MAQTAQATPVPTAQGLVSLAPSQRQAAIATLPADQQAQLMAQTAQLIRQGNQQFMARAVRKQAVCPPSSGSGTTQNYSAGASLLFNFPTAGGAFINALLFKLTLTVNCATGTGAAYAMNAGRAWALIDRIRVGFNGTQHNFRPVILPYFFQLAGYERSRSTQVLSGQSNTVTQNAIENGVPAAGAVVSTGNTSMTLWFRVPFNAIHELDSTGLMPAMGAGTQGVVEVVCAPNALGPDPILNAISTTAGTGAAVTVTGTVEVDAEYRDGMNYQTQQPLPLDIRGMPTIQYISDEVLSPLTAGTLNSHKIATLLQHAMVLSIIVDGNQSSKFAAQSNIQTLVLAQDSVLQNRFVQFGVGAGNIAVTNYFEQLRRKFGQDLDEGVIPWVSSWADGTVNPDNHEGIALLNMTTNGWTDVHHAYQLGSVGSVSGITPRVETYLISVNPAGLGIAA